MNKLYPGPGFLIGLLFIVTSILVVAGMTWYAIIEKFWIAGLMAAMMIWFSYSTTEEFLKWFTMPAQRNVRVTSSDIQTGRDAKLVTELSEIQIGLLKTKKRVNFLPAGYDMTAVTKLAFKDGSTLRFRAGQGPFTTFSPFGRNLGERDVMELVDKLTFLRDVSGVQLKSAKIHELARK